jgi:hypothetical protein
VEYMLLIYDDESLWSTMPQEERDKLYAEYGAYTNELRENGALVGANQLQSTATATTIQVRDGETLATDGPFAETKERLGGYYVIDVESLDEAIEWAAKIPTARVGKVEVRPVVPLRTPAGRR